NAIVAALEQGGVDCWIAPRDIAAGANYGAEITRGIRECSVLLLVFSRDSNESNAVFREVQNAFAEKKIIIPVRIHDVPVSDDLSFYLSGLHWLDCEAAQSSFEDLIFYAKQALGVDAGPRPNKPPQPIKIEKDVAPKKELEIKSENFQVRNLSGFTLIVLASIASFTLIAIITLVLFFGDGRGSEVLDRGFEQLDRLEIFPTWQE
ncbi:MAG: toll/interleukin-1 receptor domain-containing protein, partial [Defluviitaleaceae bacterium]|nr:toll/interleukin-1 receptor domain-containing protein [Defluviitaleaceae bacterium]